MKATSSHARIEELTARLDRYEQRLQEHEDKMVALSGGSIVSTNASPIAQPTTRRRLLKVAGAGLLGLTGAVALGGKRALATQGQAVIAGQTNTETSVTVLDASAATVNSDGVQGKASGTYSGVRGDGGPGGGYGVWALGGGTNGGGMRTQGQGTGSGIDVFGGPGGPGVNATGGVGVMATGAGSGAGVEAHGGQFKSGVGGGPGVVAIAGGGTGIGAASGQGLNATGSFNGPGVYATGNASGPGVNTFGGTSGHGIIATSGAAGGLGGWFNGVEAPIRLAAASAPGPPTSGVHNAGDLWLDGKYVLWMCMSGGVPGGFLPLQYGGMNQALVSAMSTSQYTLTNSDGSTWQDMDATNLILTITPEYACQVIICGNADLWTSVAGFNQDIGIGISGGSYPTTAGQPEAWKESGGFAGTFSPNAAFVVTLAPLLAGTTYTVKLQWKANKAGSSTIWAGAGPIGGKFSPTRLMALLIVS